MGRLKALWATLRGIWKALPPKVQAALTTCAATFVTTTVHAISEGGCVSAVCLKHYAGTALSTAVLTLYAFYMQPNGTGPKP